MPLFVLDCRDKPDHLPVRLATRAEHLAHLTGLGDAVRVAGAVLNPAGEPVGSVVIVEADDLDAAQALVAADPYARAGLFDAVTVRPWRVALGGFGDRKT